MTLRRTVLKYTLAVDAIAEEVTLPLGANFLYADADIDPRAVDLWFEVKIPAERGESYGQEQRHFLVTGTGHDVDYGVIHVASVRHQPTRLVWHIWEVPKP